MRRIHSRVTRLESRLATDTFPRMTILMLNFDDSDDAPEAPFTPQGPHGIRTLHQRYHDGAIWDPSQERWVPEAELEHVAARIDAVEAQGATQPPASSKGWQ